MACEVTAGQRVAEVDPRESPQIAGLGERPLAIARGVVQRSGRCLPATAGALMTERGVRARSGTWRRSGACSPSCACRWRSVSAPRCSRRCSVHHSGADCAEPLPRPAGRGCGPQCVDGIAAGGGRACHLPAVVAFRAAGSVRPAVHATGHGDHADAAGAAHHRRADPTDRRRPVGRVPGRAGGDGRGSAAPRRARCCGTHASRW